MLILLNFTLLYFRFLSFSLSTQQSSSISPHTVWLNHRHHHIHQLFHDWLLVSLLEKSSSSRRMICEDLGVWSHTSAPLLLSVLQWQLPQYTFPIWFISAAFVTFISLWRCSNSYPVQCSSSTSLFVYKSNHLIGPSLSAFIQVNKCNWGFGYTTWVPACNKYWQR